MLKHARFHSAVALLLAIGCTDAPAQIAPPETCNGHAELCSRSYTAVVYPGTHGSYSDVDEGFEAPDQTHSIADQLAAGIRVLHLEVHDAEGVPVLCHGLCLLGQRQLIADLEEVKTFLAEHPDNVVTLLIERSDDVVTADEIGTGFATVGLDESAYVLADAASPTAKWPTLSELIRSRHQVIALLDDTDGSHSPFLMPRWKVTWETPWNNKQSTDFGECDADRGTQGNAIYVVDTYLEDEVLPTAEHARLVNIDPFLIDRLLYCQQKTKTLPNFVMVNYYEVGDVFHVVDVLNGFASAPKDDLSKFPPSSFGAGGSGGAGGGH